MRKLGRKCMSALLALALLVSVLPLGTAPAQAEETRAAAGAFEVTGSAQLTVTKDDSALDLTAKKNGQETAAFTYGDTITIEGRVKGTEDSANALNLEQNTAQLYCGETLLGEAVNVEAGSFTLTYDTSEKGIPIGRQTLTVKYGGSDILNESSGTVGITLSKKPATAQVASERITKQYNGEPDVEVPLNFDEGILAGEDEVIVTAPNAKFSDPYVGNDKEITLGDLMVGGKDAGWYEVSAPENVTGTIIMASTRLNVSVNQDGKFVYGDKIVVTFTPEAEYVPIPSNRSLSVDADNAVLYFEDEDDNEVVLARTTGGEDDVFTLSYDTKEKKLPCDDEPFMLYIKYGGSSNLQGSEGYAQITLERAPLKNVPTISGEFVSGKTLTANYTSQDDETVTYQWNRNGTVIANATSSTYTLTTEDIDQEISVSVTATDENRTGSVTSAAVTISAPEPPYTGKYSYEVTTSVGDNGTISVDRYATEGDKVTIEVSPDEAYLLEALTITSGGKDVEVTDHGDGTYTFTMPSGDVKITATFAEDPDWTEEPEEPATDISEIFLDVAPGAWYKDAVQYAYDNGLMTGVSATEFAPEQTTTRAMIVSILARLENVTSAESAGFADVDDEWYATAVNWAASVGVVSGTGEGNFSPNAAITREQLAAMLMNYAAYKGEDVSARADLSAYSDQPSAWAEETISWSVAEGLLTGVTADELQPQGNATRAQVAAILQRYLGA